MNHVNLIGKMRSNPKIIELDNGRKIARFTMSTSEQYLDAKGTTKVKNNWHSLFAWGRWVSVLQEMGQEGLHIAIEGKLITNFYQEQGVRKLRTEIEVNDFIIL